ncbi:hypothetical protein [Gemmata sp.]|uniref:hypothetical protein n=1 Tax=Gemmata sp. TaxID=1914242 RepID=UPI003F709C71
MFPALVVLGFAIPVPPSPSQAAVAAALPKLVAGMRGHAEQKTCFACHNQAYPLLALSAARAAGHEVPREFLKAQGEHIAGFLAANKDRFRDGRGTGGAAATASFALLALDLAGYEPDDATAAAAEYLAKFPGDRDHWRTTSNRPPTEASDFTITYASMRALRRYGAAADRDLVTRRRDAAREWLVKTPARDTEDRVFRLLGLKEAGAPEKEVAAAAFDLVKAQHPSGGWAQLDGGEPDAYATGEALFALHHAGGMRSGAPAYREGAAFLLKTQQADGTWRVKTRSKPFQPYYESGFPYEKDQFISIAATGWAAAALAAK